jgi:putative ABC transport system substrate-binding protein
MMDRRVFLSSLGFATLAAPLAAEAQQAEKVFKIGFLSLGEAPTSSSIYIKAFYESLREYGWIEGKNFVFVPKYAQFKSERLPELVGELVQLKVDVIVVLAAEAALAAKHGTRTIPIVAFGVADAVAIGLVANLARPGGNVTGLSYLGTELVNKEMELLKQAVRTLSRVAVLTNPANPTHLPRSREAATTAQGLGVKVEPIEARTPSELDKAFVEMRRLRVGGVLVMTDPMFAAESSRLAQLASRSGVPAMYGFRLHVVAGGLMSYGVDLVDLYRRAATYVDKILKGAKPGDLPVEQPTKFELVINLKTAKALGLTIPPSLLGRADEVIQ